MGAHQGGRGGKRLELGGEGEYRKGFTILATLLLLWLPVDKHECNGNWCPIHLSCLLASSDGVMRLDCNTIGNVGDCRELC